MSTVQHKLFNVVLVSDVIAILSVISLPISLPKKHLTI